MSCEFFHLVEQEEGLDQLALLERGLVGAIGSDPRAAVPADGKLNCWEFKRCGREPGGARVAELGICPATSDESSDGLNGGSNGGRICWAVTGTLCKGQVQGSFAQKRLSCMSCDFYQLVEREEGEAEFAMLQPGRDF